MWLYAVNYETYEKHTDHNHELVASELNQMNSNTYLVTIFALSVELKVFAHLSSEFVHVRSRWSEVVIQGEGFESKANGGDFAASSKFRNHWNSGIWLKTWLEVLGRLENWCIGRWFESLFLNTALG